MDMRGNGASIGRAPFWVWNRDTPVTLVEEPRTVIDLDDASRGARGLAVLDSFRPIGLGEMATVALQDRTDTKFVLTAEQLWRAVAAMAGEYRVLEVEEVRLQRYHTRYFDTAALDLYLAHHAGRATRYKVRCRTYVDTGGSFLEVKRRTATGRVVKRRLPIARPLDRLTAAAAAFLDSRLSIDPAGLLPVLTNDFRRVTLVSRRRPERLTLDLDLRFGGGARTVALPGLAVAEVKQAGRGRDSAFMQEMRARGIRQDRFSKYCTGVALLMPWVKHNNFKPRLRRLARLLGGGEDAR
jgi:hypothetical protein